MSASWKSRRPTSRDALPLRAATSDWANDSRAGPSPDRPLPPLADAGATAPRIPSRNGVGHLSAVERRPQPVDEQRRLDQHGVGVEAAAAGKARGPRWAAARTAVRVGKREQHVDGGAPQGRPGRRPARNLGPKHPVAEILEHDEALVEIEGVDFGCREPAFAQALRRPRRTA